LVVDCDRGSFYLGEIPLQQKELQPMNHSNNKLNDIVAIARDGKEFYEHAVTKVNDPELKTLFSRIASIKGDIVASLSSEIRATGDKPDQNGTLVGDLNKLYGDLRAMAGSKDLAYVSQLEQAEDRLLKAFDDARSDKDISPQALAVLTRLGPEVRRCHELMRTRKQAMKHAA
jgi:uncharacterized protein (TIGR02284 family)